MNQNTDWPQPGSKGSKILSALGDGEKTRGELLNLTGGAVQNLQYVLQRLVAERRVVRVSPGLYRLAV